MTPLPGISNQIQAELSGEMCRCGRNKRRGKSFCQSCYFKLPEKLRDRLYKTRGSADTYREACAELDRQKLKS